MIWDEKILSKASIHDSPFQRRLKNDRKSLRNESLPILHFCNNTYSQLFLNILMLVLATYSYLSKPNIIKNLLQLFHFLIRLQG